MLAAGKQVANEEMETVQLLLEHGAEINSNGEDNVLLSACQDRQHDMVRLLVECGADLEMLVADDHYAGMRLEVPAIVDNMLVTRERELPEGAVRERVTVLMRAARDGDLELVKLAFWCCLQPPLQKSEAGWRGRSRRDRLETGKRIE